MPIDMTAAQTAVKPPPAARRGRPPGSANKTTASVAKTPVLELRTNGLLGIAQLAQGALMFGKQYADAAAVGMHATPIAVELAKLAEVEPIIAKGVDLFIQAGPYAALIAAAIPLVAQLATNHGMLPANSGMAGVVPPEVLRNRMETQMLQMQAEAMRDQQDALKEAQQARADMERLVQEQQRVNGVHAAV